VIIFLLTFMLRNALLNFGVIHLIKVRYLSDLVLFWQSRLSHECKWSLFDAKWANFQVYHGENKLYFNEMMKMLALYQPNMMSWIFIETYWNNSLKADMSLLKYFLEFKPNNFAATPYNSMLGRKQQEPIL